jgi:hypothetical protein
MERLRLVARSGGPPRSLAIGAAEALLPVADQPGGLLTAARRLVDRHRGHGPLVWVCARATTAPDPRVSLVGSIELLRSDPVAGRVVEALPAEAVVVCGPGVDLPAIRDDLTLATDRAALAAADVLVVAPAVAGPAGWWTEGVVDLLDEAAHHEVPVWLAVGEGAVLPAVMAERALAGLDPIGFDGVARAVGPNGAAPVETLVGRSTCPVDLGLYSGSS